MESIFLLYFKQQFSSYHVNSKLHQIYDFDGRNLDVIKGEFLGQNSNESNRILNVLKSTYNHKSKPNILNLVWTFDSSSMKLSFVSGNIWLDTPTKKTEVNGEGFTTQNWAWYNWASQSINNVGIPGRGFTFFLFFSITYPIMHPYDIKEKLSFESMYALCLKRRVCTWGMKSKFGFNIWNSLNNSYLWPGSLKYSYSVLQINNSNRTPPRLAAVEIGLVGPAIGWWGLLIDDGLKFDFEELPSLNN